MKLTKVLLIGATALPLFTSCNGSSDDPKYEVTVPRTLLVATTDGVNTRTTLTSATIGLDLYDTTSGSFTLGSFRLPGGSTTSFKASALNYTANAVGYTFKPGSTTTYSGFSGTTSDFSLYLGGISQVNTRVSIESSAATLLGYSNTMYLFSTATVSSSEGTELTTTDATVNVIQVYITENDGEYTATLYWGNPSFDRSVNEDRNLGIAGLSASIDPYAGTLTLSSDDKTITPRLFDNGSSTLASEVENYKVSDLTLTVGSFANNSVYLTFTLDYTPTASDNVVPTTTRYHFSASLRESSSLS